MSIGLAKLYSNTVDYTYRYGSKTAILDPKQEIKEVDDASGTFLIPTISTTGLADHTRGGSFVEGSSTFSYVAYTAEYDRALKIPIDAVDNKETRNVVIPSTIKAFVEEQVVPEVDAIRMAAYATAAIAAGTDYYASAVLSASDIVDAIDVANAALDDAQVPEEGRILFIENSNYGYLKNSSDITKNSIVNMGTDAFNRNIKMFDDMQIVKMPQARFYTSIDLNDGVSVGETDGGYAKSGSGYDINFILLHPSAIMQFVKHNKNKLFAPDSDDSGDNFRYLFRQYHGAKKLDSKDGIYVHYSTS